MCFFRVCDVITPEVEIGGQFRKNYLNGTLISYNLDRYGFCVTSEGTDLWSKILLEYGIFVRNDYREFCQVAAPVTCSNTKASLKILVIENSLVKLLRPLASTIKVRRSDKFT